jgi:hypothetical protein
MEIKNAKQIIQQAIDKAIQRGVFNISEAKDVIDAVITINEMVEFEPQGEPVAIEETDAVE